MSWLVDLAEGAERFFGRGSGGLTEQIPKKLGGLVVVVVVAALGAGYVYGVSVAFLTLAGGALLSAILLFWSSIQSLTDEAPMTLEEALSLNAPSAEEEQKQAVLRALKDLEYERSVGKISEEDYQTLSKRYRSDAKALLFAANRDLAPAMKRAEDLLAARIDQKAVVAEMRQRNCPICQVPNAADAQVCTSCGALMIEEST